MRSRLTRPDGSPPARAGGWVAVGLALGVWHLSAPWGRREGRRRGAAAPQLASRLAFLLRGGEQRRLEAVLGIWLRRVHNNRVSHVTQHGVTAVVQPPRSDCALFVATEFR